jgi:hypothetical protein
MHLLVAFWQTYIQSIMLLGVELADSSIFVNKVKLVYWPYSGDNQVKHIRQEGTQKGLSRNIAPSWEDVLQSSSGLPISSIYQVRKS